MPNWEEIEVPRGSYVGWGSKPGQEVTGALLVYDPVGATTPAPENAPCPLLEIELTEEAWSSDKDGNWTKFDAGQTVCLSVSQKNLQRGVQRANLHAGDLVRISMYDTEKVAKGTVKLFKVFVDRGAAKTNGSGPPVSGGGPNFARAAQTVIDNRQDAFSGTPAATGPAPGFAGGDDEPPF
jgi:hypothetical protein